MDHRRFQRLVVEKEVACLIEGSKDFVFLYDLSVGGAMIETASPLAVTGNQVVLDLSGMTDISGKIVWRINGNAGIEFDRLIPESVVQFLGYDPRIVPFRELSPRDRYGAVLHGA